MLPEDPSPQAPVRQDHAELEAQYAKIVGEQALQLSLQKSHAELIDRQLAAASQPQTAPHSGPPNTPGVNAAERLKTRAAQLIRTAWRRRETIALAVGSPVAAVVFLFVIYVLFIPQSIRYAFADQKSCVGSPAIFPSLLKTSSGGTFKLTHEPTISIGHTAIFSYRLCAVPSRGPLASTGYVNKQWLPVIGLHIGKSIKVVTGGYPVAFAGSLGTKAIPIEKPLLFKLSASDATFDYAVTANG
ncbi:MAG TPA: hypothetical protein VFC50_01950, partial [Candidatus Dormibacteraeota bacterium]|nr:hypothetical protein [Candidatus Dormibacteraeota bacterium]